MQWSGNCIAAVTWVSVSFTGNICSVIILNRTLRPTRCRVRAADFTRGQSSCQNTTLCGVGKPLWAPGPGLPQDDSLGAFSGWFAVEATAESTALANTCVRWTVAELSSDSSCNIDPVPACAKTQRIHLATKSEYTGLWSGAKLKSSWQSSMGRGLERCNQKEVQQRLRHLSQILQGEK